MTPSRRTIGTLTLGIALAAASAGAQDTTAPRPRPAQLPADSMQIARKYTQWFYTGQLDSVWARHSAGARQQLGTQDELVSRLATLTERAGKELSVIEERFVTRNGARQYWRTATFSNAPEPVLFRWVLAPNGEITGMGLGLRSQAPPVDPEP
jgi:hypothetical protein